MKNFLRSGFIIMVLAALSLACSFSAQLTQPAATPTISNILFQDDFSDKNSGWHTMQENDQVVDYAQDGFRFFINETQTDYWSAPGLSFGDVRIEVTAVKLGGPDDNDFGVLCRYQGDDSFYGFLISSDGYYGISKMAGGDHSLLGSEDMQPSDAIHQGAASNSIVAECVGSKLSLTVNGEKLLEVEDADYAKGDIGLITGTFDTGGVDILFDNLVVTRP